jgi:RNA polymerase sigma factor (sigma-70 family)
MSHHEDELIPTRASLIQRLKDLEDQRSWQEFFNIYWKLIYGVARKGGLSDAQGQDVVQETMVAAAKHMPSFRYDPERGSFKAWLLNMTRWRIIDQLRKRPLVASEPVAGDGTSTDQLENVPDPVSLVPDATWDLDWEKNLLEAAMKNLRQRLEPQKYQIFDFYVNKEWPAEKVAAKFQVSVGQVYLAKHRITDMIKEEVRRLEKDTI